MEKQITTAVIAVAGWGTRWLPLTKAIEKCMVPVGTRPVIDWIVADCVAAGITRIIFVIGENHTQIKQYFSHHTALDVYLTDKNKATELNSIRQPQYQHVQFEYAVQPEDEKYGTAYPVALAAECLEANETVLFLNGDDFIYRSDGSSETADFIAHWQAGNATHSLMVREVPKEDATAYGVIQTGENGLYKGILEKPSQQELEPFDQTFINLGKYIFGPSMFSRCVKYVSSLTDEKEFYVTTPINEAAAEGESFQVYDIVGQHLDAGNPTSWLKSNQVVMKSNY